MFEYFCGGCQAKFEQIVGFSDPDKGKCPKCNGYKTQRLVSRFAVGGQGDLRESTMHGCDHPSHDFEGSSGDHSHDPASHEGGHEPLSES